jgi:prepilin-type N-terminal cleavage/methylation domain-containing protein
MRLRGSASPSGVTLVELLVVVAIIGILCAIAVPNVVEAQTRAKVASVHSGMRKVATALESYCADFNRYPIEGNPFSGDPGDYPSVNPDASISLLCLTTPVSYLSGVEMVTDPFQTSNPTPEALAQGNMGCEDFFYANYEMFCEIDPGRWDPGYTFRAWGLSSLGTDRTDDGILWAPHYEKRYGSILQPYDFLGVTYDASNGTVSPGDIARFGGVVPPETERHLGYNRK